MTSSVSATTTSAPPRRLGRSAGALALGFVAVVMLSLGTDEVLHVLKVYPPWNEPMYDSGLCLLALSYRILYAVLGSYIAARYAPHRPMGHAMALGGGGNPTGHCRRCRHDPNAPGTGMVSDRDCRHCPALCLAGRSSVPPMAH